MLQTTLYTPAIRKPVVIVESVRPDRAWPNTPRHRAEVRIAELRRQFPKRPRRVRIVKAPDAHGLAELRWLHQFLDKLVAWRTGAHKDKIKPDAHVYQKAPFAYEEPEELWAHQESWVR